MSLSIFIDPEDTFKTTMEEVSVSLSQQIQWMVEEIVAFVAQSLRNSMGPGELIGVRSGNMSRGIKTETVQIPDGFGGHVYVDEGQVPYFHIQDQGGTILPRNARHLAIPLEAMQLYGAQVTARMVISSPETFGFLSTFTAKNVIFGKVGNVITPLFALKDSVTLRARGLTDAALSNSLSYIQSRLEAALEEAVTVKMVGA